MGRLRRGVVLAALALLLAMLGSRAAPVQAAGTLDARFTPVASFGYFGTTVTSVVIGQSFTAGRSGLLDRGGLLLVRYPLDVTFRMELWALDGDGFPVGAALAISSDVTLVGASPFANSWVEATFPTPATVTAGTRYALLGRLVSGQPLELVSQQSNPYPGGTAVARFDSGAPIQYSSEDIGFRVYIDTPAPRYTLTGATAPNPVPLTQPLTFSFTASNTGGAAGANTLLTVTLPAGVQQQGAMAVLSGGLPAPGATCTLRTGLQISCALGSLPIGATYTVAIPVRVVSGTLGMEYCARGVLSGGVAGGTSTATAQACARTTISGDLVATLNCPATLASGADLPSVCTVTVRNAGGTDVTVAAGQRLLSLAVSGTAGGDWGAGTLSAAPGYHFAGILSGSAAIFSGSISYQATATDVIPPGGTRTFTAAWATSIRGPGTHTVTVTVNPDGVITEASKANNTAGPLTTTILAP